MCWDSPKSEREGGWADFLVPCFAASDSLLLLLCSAEKQAGAWELGSPGRWAFVCSRWAQGTSACRAEETAGHLQAQW